VANPGFPARWPTAALGRHAVSGGGPRAKEGREGKDDRDSGETIELSGKILKTRVI
jgi:hypothetical protein